MEQFFLSGKWKVGEKSTNSPDKNRFKTRKCDENYISFV
jgi:hypothetical protein